MSGSMAPLHLNSAGVPATIFVSVLLVIMLALLWGGWRTPETVVFMALVIVWNVGIVTTKEALSGFSNTGMLAVGALFVVISAVERSQVAERVAVRIFGLETGPRAGLLRMMVVTFFLSAFLNNTPIVALCIPIVRDWARMRGFPSSSFLMPLSFATILGGLLTTIGTSTNLVVQGLLRNNGLEPVGFFEPGYIGLPAGIIGIIYMWLACPWLLSGREGAGLFRYIRDRADEVVTEMQLDATFPYLGRSLGFVMAKLGLPFDTVIKVRRMVQAPADQASGAAQAPLSSPVTPGGSYVNRTRDLWGRKGDLRHRSKKRAPGHSVSETSEEKTEGVELRTDTYLLGTNGATPAEKELDGLEQPAYNDMYPPDMFLQVQAGDIIFLSCSKTQMMSFQGGAISTGVKGVTFLDVTALDLAGHGTEFFEMVLSTHNPFVGIDRSVPNSEFSGHYGCTVLAVRQHGGLAGEVTDDAELKTDDDDAESNAMAGKMEVRNHHFVAGDTVLVLAGPDFFDKWGRSKDFFMVSQVGKSPQQVRKYDYIPLGFFVLMLAWVAAQAADMVRGAMTLAAIVVAGNWVSAKTAVSTVDWSLLLLIGSALGLSQAISNSGLAQYIGDGIRTANISPLGSLFLVFIFTMGITELVTNNAAAALAFPISIQIANVLEVSYKPFAITVMIAASASFLTPIGYQTNTMVWGPGGYNFFDFPKIGFPLTICYLLVSCLLTPLVFPF